MTDATSGANRAFTCRPFSELRLGLTVWAAFILATCAYCLVHQVFVSSMTPDVGRTFTLAFREWGAWGALAPWAVQVLCRPARWRDVMVRCVLFALLAASLPITVDQLTGERTFIASLALFWPRNLAMAVALLFIARVLGQPAVPESSRPTATLPSDKPNTLLVAKGADQCLIRIDDIQHLTAAGNYVDIRARDQNYLMRATMSELEALLPAAHFVRVHRSHIVRVREIERIRIERFGSGTVHLRSGATIAISKSYRAQLKHHQDVLKHSVH